jgi:hypothetical protein
MAAVTTRHGPAPAKAWSWSYSKLKNFEACPKKHYHVDIAKDAKEDDSEELKWGNQLHDRMAKRLVAVMKGGLEAEPLPLPMKHMEGWIKRLIPGGVLPPEVTLLVEQKLAIKQDFTGCTYFDKEAWFRGIGDVIKLAGNVGLILDWKTGKIKEDSVQLALMAQCVFSHYPEIQKVRAEFAWLKENATTREDFHRSDMPAFWRDMWPRIQLLKQAADTMNYPPKQGGLCRKWCPVKVCPHWGE